MPQEPRCDIDAPWPVTIFGETAGMAVKLMVDVLHADTLEERQGL